jgi:hypothetical protein
VAADEPLTIYRMQFQRDGARDPHRDRDTLAFWLKLVLEFDEIMHHTPGAHELASSGVRMLACAGDTYFEFADAEVHDEQLAC